jgi:hypothetical protein
MKTLISRSLILKLGINFASTQLEYYINWAREDIEIT